MSDRERFFVGTPRTPRKQQAAIAVSTAFFRRGCRFRDLLRVDFARPFPPVALRGGFTRLGRGGGGVVVEAPQPFAVEALADEELEDA